MEVLKECGIAYELLDKAGVCRAEPALAQSPAPIAGGLRLPEDETGDCFLFTNALAKLAEGLGVQFRWNTEIDQLTQGPDGRISGVRIHNADGSAAETLQADRYVLALGSFSRPLLQSTGLDLPIYPVKGYSLTIPIENEALAPGDADADRQVVQRIGERPPGLKSDGVVNNQLVLRVIVRKKREQERELRRLVGRRHEVVCRVD